MPVQVKDCSYTASVFSWSVIILLLRFCLSFPLSKYRIWKRYSWKDFITHLRHFYTSHILCSEKETDTKSPKLAVI